jgi:hypothetical protein
MIVASLTPCSISSFTFSSSSCFSSFRDSTFLSLSRFSRYCRSSKEHTHRHPSSIYLFFFPFLITPTKETLRHF